ncbi:glucose-induced degradation protein 4 homolog [Zophobas morio]|uniref:glucose-induced degradation protein 4 homolog n=1 Tax=Zophobas morio TaxID=2755281 RepID=UPI0030836DEA
MPDSRPKYFASLFPGAHYVGQQKSNHNSFEVEVEIKHVDLSDSFLCGYLRIEHLTEEFPVITTFFEADIIGEKYSFLTRKWDTNEEVDRKHWEKFEPFKQYSQVFNNEDFHYDFYNSQYIFMRWKEQFLVPDHRIEDIAGASFSGFYYICFDRVSETFQGFYYHQKSQWFQSLKLKRILNRTFPVFEFR